MPVLSAEDTIVADLPYPIAGSSQHLTVVKHSGSEAPEGRRHLLPWQDLSRTVLASAFVPNKRVVLQTPLDPPYDRIVLPPLHKSQLRPEVVQDEQGRCLGVMLQVPGLFVHANRVLENHLAGSTQYNYRAAVTGMVKESARLLSSVVKSGVIRVRSHPGIMAHALELEELAYDEVGISEQFAGKLLKHVQKKLPLQFGSIWDLDGFPVYAVRFPVANRHGVQECYLRILPGVGQYVACHPFNMAKMWLGDRDGDALFALLRWEGVKEHTLEIAKRPRADVNFHIRNVQSCVTLQGLRDPATLNCEPKLQKKMVPPDLTTFEARMKYIQDADTRTHVATYTMVFGWWVPRILASSGKYGPREAYQLGNDLLEIFIEWCMDARKPEGSPLSNPAFDGHGFMRLLRFGKRRGENIDFCQLREMGIPSHLVDILQEAWEISSGNMPKFLSSQPVYNALVLGRNSTEQSVPKMLTDLKSIGVQPEDLYMAIVKDLTCSSCISLDGGC